MNGYGGRYNPMGVAGSIYANPYASAYAAPGLPTVAGDVGGGPTTKWGQAGGWIKKNPETALGIAGLIAGVYGAHKQGQAEDRSFQADQGNADRNYALDKEGLALRTRELDTRVAGDEAEKRRRQRALMQILAQSRTPVPPTPATPPGV